MRILVANDDGVFSPGLQALADVASQFGEVRVVAPEVEQSSVGHGITASRPLTYRRTQIGKFDGFRVNGTPADCIALGIHNWSGVDAVLSGINQGLNVGAAMWHSGTLAAAKQAALFGVRGIALSAAPLDTIEAYLPLKPWCAAVLEALLSAQSGSLLTNVNFPTAPRGVRWTRQSVRHYDGKVQAGKDPYGRTHFWFTAVPIEGIEDGSDRWALSESLVSVTPLRMDLTDETALAHAAQTLRFDDQALLKSAKESGSSETAAPAPASRAPSSNGSAGTQVPRGNATS
jgi:5'-nucleotidase